MKTELFREIIKQFEENLNLAKEEQPNKPLQNQIKIAEEWTQDDFNEFIGRIAENRIAKHQDDVNKFHFC